MSGRPLLEATGVSWSVESFDAARRQILSDVSLTISPGERVGLVGRSGSGKTTLVTILAGLLSPDAGSVRATSGDVGLVFQEPERGFFAETVLQDVAFGPRNRGVGEEEAHLQARDALERVGLDPDRFGGRAPETLSGGEARRAGIAGTIAYRPRVLLFDEPTLGLDADGVARFRDLLASLVADDAGTLLVSHDLDLVAAECDRVLVLDDGVVVWGGPSDCLADGLPESWRAFDPLGFVKREWTARGKVAPDVPATPASLAEAWCGGKSRSA